MSDKSNDSAHHYDFRESSSQGKEHTSPSMRHSAPAHDKQGAHSKAHHGHPAKTEHPAVMLATGSEQNIEHELHVAHEHEHEHAIK
ncbi:hypothetical protein BGX20_008628 [Mortierella sp. AD010]|nr:hypothetical protein BGX20_008628 [Mortierella sp. AD010]